MRDKPLIWLGSSRRDLRAFPEGARRLAGFQLRLVQHGSDPADWKPVPVVGRGVREIRIHVEGAHRVFYVATFAEGVYVLHAFEKKTRKTAERDLELGRDRFQAITRLRQGYGKKRDAKRR